MQQKVWLAAAGILVCVGACSKSSSDVVPTPAPASAAPGVVAAASSGSAAAPSGGAPVCTVAGRTVWGKWANQRTGITATTLADGRVALGVAFGDDPTVLEFDRSGKGELHRIAVPKELPLGTDMKKGEGKRDLQRVSAALASDGSFVAYADYRDRWQDGRRRVACGLADSKDQLMVFDGTPLLDGKSKPGAAAPPVKPGAAAVIAPRLKLPMHLRPATVAPATSAVPSAAPPAPTPAPAVADAGAAATEVESEIRDCRSFVDPGGKDVWAAGTELRGETQSDGSKKWSMRLLVLPRAGGATTVIHSTDLPADPKKLETYETAVAARHATGWTALLARYNGALLGWTLDSRRHRQTGPRRWGAGYPSPPRLLVDGDDLLAVTAVQTKDTFVPRFARIGSSGIPAALSEVSLASNGPSGAEPVLALAGNQRWLAFQSGKRREGLLRIVPVDEKLTATGRAFEVTAGDESVYESYLIGLDGGRLLVVYIRNGSAAELVSEELTCSVQA